MKIRTTVKELKKIIREEKASLLREASDGEIERLRGKEVSMRYRKATGEVRTYFGRIVKVFPGGFFMGVLNKGLRRFITANVMAVSPASLEEMLGLQECSGMDAPRLKEYFDEMCKEANDKPTYTCPKCDSKVTMLGKFGPQYWFRCTKCGKEFGDDINPGMFKFEGVPKAWSGTAKAMSKHKEIDNPWALTNWLAKQGAHPHYKPTKKEVKDPKSFDAQYAYKMYVYAQKKMGAKIEPFEKWVKGWKKNEDKYGMKGNPTCYYCGKKADSKFFDTKWGHDFCSAECRKKFADFDKNEPDPTPVGVAKMFRKKNEKCGEPVLKPQYRGKQEGLVKETPMPTSLGTGNVQQVKKCPTCEGVPELKIGCPTCGGSGRVKPSDKFTIKEGQRPVKTVQYKGYTIRVWKEEGGYVASVNNHFTGISDSPDEALETVKYAINKKQVMESKKRT